MNANLDTIFYNPDHTKTYNPSGKPTGVVMTDFDIMEAKQAIQSLINEARIDELTKPDELDVWILRLAKYANTLTPYKLDDPIDPIVQDGLNEAKQAIQAHIDKKVNEVLDRVMSDETLKEEIDTWIRQAYVNGSLDVNNPEPQGSDVCTELIMQLIKKDRERAVREARVDELKSIALVCWDLEDGEDPNDAVAIEVEHRIADLQSTIKTNQSI